MNNFRTNENYMQTLGNRIKAYRIMKGMSQKDLADKAGISGRSISRLEQGTSVQTETLFKILEALDLGDNIDMLVPDQTKRPSYYLQKPVGVPQRVRKQKVQKQFKWGDEK